MWLTRARAGDVLYVAGANRPYYIAEVVSDISLRLSELFTEGPVSNVIYALSGYFSESFNVPYPKHVDVKKATLLNRSVSKLDEEFDTMNDRVFALEYPSAAVLDMKSTLSV